MRSLTRRLELGLILIDCEKNAIRIYHKPGKFRQVISGKKRKSVLKEFSGRSLSRNQGGIKGKKSSQHTLSSR